MEYQSGRCAGRFEPILFHRDEWGKPSLYSGQRSFVSQVFSA
jgi:hypothetical protein